MTLRTLALRRIWAYSLSAMGEGGGIRDEKTVKLSRNTSQFVAQSRPTLYFLQHYSFLQPKTKVFCCATGWSHKVKNAKHGAKTCSDALLHEKLRVFVFRPLKHNRNQKENLFWSYSINRSYLRCYSIKCTKQMQLTMIFNLFYIWSDNLHSIRQKRRTRLEISSVAPLS